MTRHTGECTTSTSRASISFSAATKNKYEYVWELQTRYGQRSCYQERLHPLDIVFMWNCIRYFPHYCTIFHFIDRTTFYAITNLFVQLPFRHAYLGNLRSLVGTSLRVSDDEKWPPGHSVKLLHTALRILQQNNKVRPMTRTGDRGAPEKLNLCKAGNQLPNTYILLDNKYYNFLPGEKAWKSTWRKMLSVTLCHFLSTAFGRSFWEYCFCNSTRHRLGHRGHYLETGIIISFSSNALQFLLLHR